MKLKAFFNPRSVAVIGASREPRKVGHKVLKNLIDYGFKGEIYPINPNAEEILGCKCYSSVLDVPSEIDLSIIAVPSRIVPNVAEECGVKGVKGIVVISAGFSETGREGARLEKKLLDICRRYGMRMQGPNCLGIINTASRLNASFATANPPRGRVAFISQSGALGSTILNWAIQKNIGFSSFISLGNEADLNAADFLEALSEDEETKVIGLYMEGVKDGRRFLKVSRELSRIKPIVALKAGTTDVGIRAVSSHTGSLAGSNVSFSAAFKKAGILRVNTLEELFNLVLALEEQPPPKGKRVLIVTNGGGPGILAADACEKNGLELPSLEYHIRENLRRMLPPHASVNNPVDVLGDADESRYEIALSAGLKSSRIDGIIVILTPQAMTPTEKIANVTAKLNRMSRKPIISAFMGLEDDSLAIKILRRNGVPNYEFPEDAAYVLSRMYEYQVVSSRRREKPPIFPDIKLDEINEIITQAHNENRLNLTIEESIQICRASGIPTPPAAVAKSRNEAIEIAESIGYPVAMKIVSPSILHKTDVGGVILDVKSSQQVKNNYDKLLRRVHTLMPHARVQGVLIQKMVPKGREVIVGCIRDIQFGPLMMFGLGGIYVDFLRDVSYRLCPITRMEAEEMIRETKAYTLLRGVRGEPPSDINSVIDVILRLSYLMSQIRGFSEMEINPLLVYERSRGCSAVDIRVTLSKKI